MTLLSELVAGGGERLTWIDFSGYARRIFAGDPADWYRDPTRLALTLAQAHRVIGSEVVTFDAAGLLSMSVTAAAPTPVARCELALGDQGLASRLTGSVDAVLHQFEGKAEVALGLPSSTALLVSAGAAPEDRSPDDVDDIAMMLVDVVRAVAGRPLKGLVLASGRVPDGAELESWAPLTAAAAYYGWVRVARVSESVPAAAVFPAGPLDLIVGAKVSAALVGPGAPWGGGLGESFWRGRSSEVPGKGLRYGEVPADGDPDLVAERAGWLFDRAERA